MWRNWNACAFTVGGIVPGQPLWKTVWWLLTKLNIELPCGPAVPLLGIDPKEPKARTRTDICTPVFIAASFRIVTCWKRPKCPPRKEQINLKIWSIPTVECYSALKRKESLAQGTAWMNLLDIMLSETSQIQQDNTV